MTKADPGPKYALDTDETQLPGLHERNGVTFMPVVACSIPAGADVQVWQDEDDVIIFVQPHDNPVYIPSDTEAILYIYRIVIIVSGGPCRRNAEEMTVSVNLKLHPRQLGP